MLLQNGRTRVEESSNDTSSLSMKLTNEKSHSNEITLFDTEARNKEYQDRIKNLENELKAHRTKEKDLMANISKLETNCESFSQKIENQQSE